MVRYFVFGLLFLVSAFQPTEIGAAQNVKKVVSASHIHTSTQCTNLSHLQPKTEALSLSATLSETSVSRFSVSLKNQRSSEVWLLWADTNLGWEIFLRDVKNPQYCYKLRDERFLLEDPEYYEVLIDASEALSMDFYLWDNFWYPVRVVNDSAVNFGGKIEPGEYEIFVRVLESNLGMFINKIKIK